MRIWKSVISCDDRECSLQEFSQGCRERFKDRSKKLWLFCIKEAEKTLNKLNIKINTLDACRYFGKSQ